MCVVSITDNVVLLLSYRFRLNAITQVSHDSFIYSFNLPDGQVTGIGVGQHAIMR